MTRYVYGGGGDTALVDTNGNILANTSATVYSAQTGGSVITDIQTLAVAPLAGTVTSDAYGQIIFRGPDGYTATLWLQFAGQPIRWAARPANTDLIVLDELATGPTLTNPVLNTPTLKGTSMSTPAVGTVSATTQAIASQTANLAEYKTSAGVVGASVNAAGHVHVQSTNPNAIPATVQGASGQSWDLMQFKNAAGSVMVVVDASGRITGQGVPHLIARQQLVSNASSIVFSGIPGVWRDLRLVLRLRGTTAADQVAPLVQMNSVTSGYDASLTQDFNSFTSGGASTNLGAYWLTAMAGFHGGFAPAANASANAFCCTELLIPEYNDTTKRKMAVGHGGYSDGTRHYVMSVLSHNAAVAAVSSLTIVPIGGAGSWLAGSAASLYGQGV